MQKSASASLYLGREQLSWSKTLCLTAHFPYRPSQIRGSTVLAEAPQALGDITSPVVGASCLSHDEATPSSELGSVDTIQYQRHFPRLCSDKSCKGERKRHFPCLANRAIPAAQHACGRHVARGARPAWGRAEHRITSLSKAR